jgi:hypothetical protein
MSDASINAGGDFRVGDVLSRAWNIFSGNLAFFLGITSLIYLAIIVAVGGFVAIFFLAGASADVGWLAGIGIFLAVILFLSLNTIAEAVLLFGAFQVLRGQSIRVGEALQRAFARFFPLIGLGILWSLGIMIGMVLLIVPGVILLCMWAVAVPACVVEGLGPTASMSRSADLSKGYRWKILGLLLLLGVINAVGGKLIEVILGLAGDWLSSIGSLIWFVAWNAYWNCVLIMIYHDLRVAKEGIDTEQIASVFD